MRVAIIGAGFLGEQIYRDILPSCDEVILTHCKNKKYPDSRKFDFFADKVEDIFGNKKVDIVFLSAKIEFAKDEEILKDAMIRFLQACQGSRVIYISSDGIFDGKKGQYRETDLPGPITLYGRNLKICEDLVKKYASNYCIIRPSCLYGFVAGALDSRLEKARTEIGENKKIIRFDDMYKSPLSYIEASRISIKIALLGYIGIVHISGKRMSVFEFTKKGLEALGVATKNLSGVSMPTKRPIDFLPDTSLSFDLMKELTSISPLDINEGCMQKPS